MTPMDAAPNANTTPSSSPGSELLGALMMMFLCGVAVMQAHDYFNYSREESVWTRRLAWLLSFLNLLRSIFVCVDIYHDTVVLTSTRDAAESLKIMWTIPTTIIMNIVIGSIVLLYYNYICFRLLADKRLQIPVTIVLLIPIVIYIVFGIILVVQLCEAKTVLAVAVIPAADESYAFIPWFSSQLAADVLIAITLCLALPTPSHKRTRNIIQKIIIYTISRGIITSVGALLQLIQLAVPNATWAGAAERMISSLYTVSFFSLLNARRRLRRQLETGGSTASGLTPPQPTAVSIPLEFYKLQSSTSESEGGVRASKSGVRHSVGYAV